MYYDALARVCSSVWLEVGLSHPHKIQDFVDGAGHCRLKLVDVFHDFTGRFVIYLPVCLEL